MSFISLILPLSALIAGVVIGLGFGLLQMAATRRHTKLQEEGKFSTGWAATPGSFRRVGYLLVALAAVQFLCPIFFSPGSLAQWGVSLGVVIGYGRILYTQMRRRLA